MTKEVYKALLDADTEEISLTKEDVKEWLDELIEADRNLREKSYALDFGKLDLKKGWYEHRIEPCTNTPSLEMHIYTGIDLIADMLGEKLAFAVRDDLKYRYEYSFRYKDYKLFQIEEKRLEGRAE